MAVLCHEGGTLEEVEPKNGRDFKLEELLQMLGCERIDIVRLGNGRIIVIDDEGKFTKGVNPWATAVAIQILYEGDYIAGTALVCNDEEVR